jgi:hypothetical protein
MHQILLAFSKLEIGSKIILKYELKTKKPYLDKHFDSFYDFGEDAWIKNNIIKIRSEIPLYILVNDPENHLKIKKYNNDDAHNIEVKLIKDIYKEFINEPKNALLNQNTRTFIFISTSDNWKQLAKNLSKQNFSKIYDQELPQEFINIFNVAEKIQNNIDQINIVTSYLNDKIQYLSDTTTIKGRFAPRDLDVIAKSQLGDCKNLSAATISILNKLGYKAQFALVLRGEGSPYPNTLPSMFVFNHAIVKATDKNGKIYCIDSTNLQSMADGIFPDIAWQACVSSR